MVKSSSVTRVTRCTFASFIEASIPLYLVHLRLMRFLKYSRALYLHAYATGYFDAVTAAITRVSPVRAFPYTAVRDLSQKWHRADSADRNNATFRLVRNRGRRLTADYRARARQDQPFHQIYIALLQLDRTPDRILYGVGAAASQANFQIRLYRK